MRQDSNVDRTEDYLTPDGWAWATAHLPIACAMLCLCSSTELASLAMWV
jgi:hypothetical protein